MADKHVASLNRQISQVWETGLRARSGVFSLHSDFYYTMPGACKYLVKFKLMFTDKTYCNTVCSFIYTVYGFHTGAALPENSCGPFSTKHYLALHRKFWPCPRQSLLSPSFLTLLSKVCLKVLNAVQKENTSKWEKTLSGLLDAHVFGTGILKWDITMNKLFIWMLQSWDQTTWAPRKMPTKMCFQVLSRPALASLSSFLCFLL